MYRCDLYQLCIHRLKNIRTSCDLRDPPSAESKKAGLKMNIKKTKVTMSNNLQDN